MRRSHGARCLKPAGAGLNSLRKGDSDIGEKALQNRLTKLQKIMEQQEALEQEAEKIRQEIKADMEAKQVEELRAGAFVVRWKTLVSSRLDGKALKAALPEIYKQYCKASTSRRFTIA